jgi:hypothetical protein
MTLKESEPWLTTDREYTILTATDSYNAIIHFNNKQIFIEGVHYDIKDGNELQEMLEDDEAWSPI